MNWIDQQIVLTSYCWDSLYCVSVWCLLRIFTCVNYAEARLSYRLDVCLSVTRWYCIKMAEHTVMLSSPHDSPFILVLCFVLSSRNSNGVTPLGPLNRGGVRKCHNFRPITCYISETVEDRWVHAARRFTSIESSFQPCDICRDCPTGTQGRPKCAKNVLNGELLNFRLQLLGNGWR